MNRRPALQPYTPPADRTAVFLAIAEAMAVAESYAQTARAFADLGDIKGLGYALRCTSAAVLNANTIASELLPAPQNRGTA